MKGFLFLCLTVVLTMASAFAQVDIEQGAALLKPVLEVLMTYLPVNVLAIISLIGGFRVIFKPLMTLLQVVTEFTPSKKDDELYKEVSEGNTLKTIRFVLDYIASIKLPAKKK